MKRLIKILVSAFSIIFFFVPVKSSADILGNAGQYAKDQLKLLTSQASVNTLNAFSHFFSMLSQIEDSSTNNKKVVSDLGKKLNFELNNSIEYLSKAQSLKDYEFAALDSKIKKINFNDIVVRFKIRPDYSIWIEVVGTLKAMGGRGWLDQNLTLNRNLATANAKFVENYISNPSFLLVWQIADEWGREFSRGKFLSIVLFEQ